MLGCFAVALGYVWPLSSLPRNQYLSDAELTPRSSAVAKSAGVNVGIALVGKDAHVGIQCLTCQYDDT